MDIFNEMDALLRAFWYIALPASLIFIIQAVMTFMGTDASDGVQPDFDGDLGATEAPFQLFSLRNLINFLLGFSWTGISLFDVIPNPVVLIAVAVAVGALFVYVFFVIIRFVQQLAEDNTFTIDSTLNKAASVYLTIPGKRSGSGKVMISVKGAYHELEAVTDGDAIPSGVMVTIVHIENTGLLVVEHRKAVEV